ncbi:hypothetical protein CR203_03565 [Salipaludibacillus neizhouensis]|uniref:ATP-grasp domain-containing protein n=1 Tax=Salipaludibacillus neizhouensis TaxID=885475 RepID=A0A3A9KXF4_9BACI|nr:YheC/YheD family protein [Salipaludibacillus neizhouensis]RKL69126.1 hypothetical protein CR203_03565 [Salipaludibacillus neizhouensis]
MTEQKKLTGNLGVLVSNRAWKGITNNNPHYRLEKLSEANEYVNFNMFFFSINTVDIQKQLITGYYFDFTNNLWEKDTFPYPDVLYRRGGASKKYRNKYLTFIEQCNEKKTVCLNPSSLGNWDIYNYFGTLKPLKSFLLDTILYEGPEDLFDMMKKHQTIYLKGVTGRKGQNVVRVEHLPGDKYLCKHFDYIQDEIHSKSYEKLDEMIPFIDKFYKGKKFMIQEAIDLLEVNNRRIDLRAELQRNKKKGIEISGISARVSQENSPITIHSHAFPVGELFDWINLSPKEKLRMQQRIETFLYKIYTETEFKYGEFGEIGIDFGLTKDLEIKFIECNSQSAKVSLLKAYGENTVKQTMVNILLYAKDKLEETGWEGESNQSVEAVVSEESNKPEEAIVSEESNQHVKEALHNSQSEWELRKNVKRNKLIQKKKIKYKRPRKLGNSVSTHGFWFVKAT